jgi:hypothetical protein
MKMSEQHLGVFPSGQNGGAAELPEPRDAAPQRRRATDRTMDRAAEDSHVLTRFEQDQLAREFADIERASAALRLGEPALRSWTKPTLPQVAKKPRPLWLLIGILWLSTALVTVGAVAAIATFAG